MASPRRNGKTWWWIGTATVLMLVPVALAQAEDLEAATAARMGDYATAVARWSVFAQQGDADSAYRLAQSYDTGRGVARNARQADYWYRVAASHGSGPAAYALGLQAENAERSDGLPQDIDAAIGWYRQALAAGDPQARERLAALGAGESEEDKSTRRAAAPAASPVVAPVPTPAPPATASPDAPSKNFDRVVGIWRERGLEGTDSTAIAALVAAAKQGYPLAQYDLAYAYEHGLGVPAEPVRAYAWYKRAEHSNGPARLREAAGTNGRLLGDKLSDAQKQAADRIDIE
jgi:TPR repeat protein